jgi:hypothetical protein
VRGATPVRVKSYAQSGADRLRLRGGGVPAAQTSAGQPALGRSRRAEDLILEAPQHPIREAPMIRVITDPTHLGSGA